MLFWRDLSSALALLAAEQAPHKSRARAGGRRLSVHAEAVTAILSSRDLSVVSG
jgi:hypothetical protein